MSGWMEQGKRTFPVTGTAPCLPRKRAHWTMVAQSDICSVPAALTLHAPALG